MKALHHAKCATGGLDLYHGARGAGALSLAWRSAVR